MIKTFIEDFIQTSYYQQIFAEGKHSNILGIYVVGSTCLGLADQDSDYDLLILTLQDPKVDTIEKFNLKQIRYKGKKVHWWYFPISWLFKAPDSGLNATTAVQLRFFDTRFTVYENHVYSNQLTNIFQYKHKISKLAIYNFFNIHRSVIEEVIENGAIPPKYYYYKYFYQLCLSAYYLLNETPDNSFLLELKRIYCKPISNSTNQQAVYWLKRGLEYIDTNYIDYNGELHRLSEILF